MYMAVIYGWTEVQAFSKDKDKAMRLAVKEKKRLCKDDDIDRWTWKNCEEYYGASVYSIKEGMAIVDGEVRKEQKNNK